MLSGVRLFATPWIAAGQASLSITDSMDVSLSELRELAVYICMKHLTLIKVKTADPAWLLHNTSVYKSRPWKIKNWDQFLEILVSPCLSLSLTLAESPSGARNPPCLLIMPGLLRSDRGGLSVSSPPGEQKDACGLRKWCKLLVLKFYWSPA